MATVNARKNNKSIVSWVVEPGDLVLIERDRERTASYTLGVVEGVYADGETYVLHNPVYRIRLAEVYGRNLPDVVEVPSLDLEPRSAKFVKDMKVGPKAIARRLRQLSPLFKGYAAEIATMEKPYLQVPANNSEHNSD